MVNVSANALRLLRGILIVGSFLFLVTSIAHGPGRGISDIPAGHELAGTLGVLKILTYASFLVGAILFPKRIRIAACFLAMGLVAKGLTEMHTSLLKRLLEASGGIDLKWAFEIFIYYTLSYVIPSVLLFTCARKLRRTKLAPVKSA